MKIKSIFLFVALILLGGIFMSNRGGRAKDGRMGMTGAPGDAVINGSLANCSYCHSGGNYTLNPTIEMYDSENKKHTSYTPGETYKMVLKMNPTVKPPRYGFQMIAILDATSVVQNTLTIPSIDGQITTLNARQYFEHNKASTLDSFTVQWTAPAIDLGSVSFYYVALAANGNNENNGDRVFQKKTTIFPATAATNSKNVSKIKLYPNPSQVDIKINSPVEANTATIINSIGNKVSENVFIQNESIDIRDLKAGLYFIQLSDKSGKIVALQSFLKI